MPCSVYNDKEALHVFRLALIRLEIFIMLKVQTYIVGLVQTSEMLANAFDSTHKCTTDDNKT